MTMVLVQGSGESGYWNWLNGGTTEPGIGPSINGADLLETQINAQIREQALANSGGLRPVAQTQTVLTTSGNQVLVSTPAPVVAAQSVTNNLVPLLAIGFVLLLLFKR